MPTISIARAVESANCAEANVQSSKRDVVPECRFEAPNSCNSWIDSLPSMKQSIDNV